MQIEHYAALADWLAQHWHDTLSLREAQRVLQPFVAQHARASMSASGTKPEAWRHAAWTAVAQLQMANEANVPLQPQALRWLNDAQDARALVQASDASQLLDLSGLTELAPVVAAELAPHTGALDLSGLQVLEPEVAQALACHTGLIRLDGLQRLTGAIVPLVQRRNLRQVGQPAVEQPALSLRGLDSLTPEEAYYLSHVQGDLDLSGLKSVSPTLAGALARSNASDDMDVGWLHLHGWTSPPIESLKALAPYAGPLSLALADDAGLRAALAVLAQQPRTGLALPQLHCLTVSLCELLSALPVKEMHLNGVLTLDRPCAMALATVKWQALHLDGVQSITLPTASALVPQTVHGTNLFMASLQLSTELRSVLKDHKNLDGPLGQRVWAD